MGSLLNLIPVQYRLLAAGLAVLAIFTVGGYSAWRLASHYYQPKVEREALRADKAEGRAKQIEAAYTQLAGEAADQTAKVRAWESAANQARAKARQAMLQAERRAGVLESELGRLRAALSSPSAKTCEDAANEIRAGLKRLRS